MGKKTIKRKRKSGRKPSDLSRKVREISQDKLEKILSQTRQFLNEEDAEILEDAIGTLAVVTSELEAKGASVARLRRLLFGATTEKMSNLFPDENKETTDNAKSSDNPDSTNEDKTDDDKSNVTKKKKRKGHGRNGTDKYTGAARKKHTHESLTHKSDCPEEGCDGQLYIQKEPKRLLRVTGVAPLTATVHELERLRCNLCGRVFTAKGPEGVGSETYDNKARAMIALLKYGSGTPFYRLEKLQKNLGIPLPSSTQWDEIVKAGRSAFPIYTELIAEGANGKLVHNDDTTSVILNLDSPPLIGKNGKERTGTFTSGILSVGDNYEIALFFTGREHAGENLEKVLAHRNKDLAIPIQMSDGLNVNTCGNFASIDVDCNTHSRRKFVEVKNDYPADTRHILNVFKAVYKNDDATKPMSDADRMAYHVEHSKPLLDGLKEWFNAHVHDEKTRTIEPNSILGDAIKYMEDHWDKLTMFLHIPGVPLDNNACERILKKAILHRKNAMFFKTENGAHMADVFMSIIHTCELNGVNPFEYLVAIADNAEAVIDNPSAWLPWNYQLNH
jgi:hypothetical protein